MPRPILAELPQTDTVRQQVLGRIAQARKIEEHSGYNVFRTLQDYDQQAGGLSKFLAYVTSRPTRTLLEIGAGRGFAAKELRSQGIHILTTGLLPYDDKGLPLPDNKAASRTTPDFLTSAEELEGVPPVDGILAIHSLGYCHSPQLAIRMIDRKLNRGGVLKALFVHEEQIAKIERRELRQQNSFKAYAQELQELGYDVAIKVNELNEERPVILVAVKPGNQTRKAADLLEEDFVLCKQTYGPHIS